MAIISQNVVKFSFLVISGQNSGEMEGESHYYLKKQSQFPKGQMGLNIVNTKAYGKIPYWRLPKNKASQSQWPTDGDRVQRVANSQQTIDNSKSQIVNRYGDLKKQTQFPRGQNECKVFSRNGL
jgi:hypothetical protein